MRRQGNDDIAIGIGVAFFVSVILVGVAALTSELQDAWAVGARKSAAMAETQIPAMSMRIGDMIDEIDSRGFANDVGEAYNVLKRDQQTLNSAVTVQDPAQKAEIIQNVRAGLKETTYSIFLQTFHHSPWLIAAGVAFLIGFILIWAYNWDRYHYWPWENRRRATT